MRASMALPLLALGFISSIALAEKLPPRLPLHLRYGMSRREVDAAIGRKAEKGTTRWLIPGKIVYKGFAPKYAVVHFEPDEAEVARWRNKVAARLSATKSHAEWQKIFDEPMPEFKSNKLVWVTIFQKAESCDELRSVFPDAMEFITATYEVTLTTEVNDDLLRAWNCLGGKSHFKFRGRHGEEIELSAIDDPTEGSEFASGPKDVDGVFDILVSYSKGTDFSQERYEKTKSNL